MIFPKNIIGPKFEKGDLISFQFDGAELIFRTPIIPINDQNIDEACPLKNFHGVNTSDWSTNDQDRPYIQLSQQLWCYENARTLDDIAQSSLYMSLIECTQQDSERNTLLIPESFEELMLSWMDYSFANHVKPEDRMPNGGSTSNPYKLKPIEKQHLNWLSVQVRFVPEAAPCPMCIIPINNRFVLMTSLEIESLHYAGRTNPYSNELLKQFEFDLFEDFLSHIKVEYTPETIAQINLLNNKTPA